MRAVRVGLVLLIDLLISIATAANLNSKPEGVIEIGKTNNKKVKILLEEFLKDNKLTPVELKTLYDARAKILVAENEIAANHLKKLHEDYDLIVPGYMASELDKLIAEEYVKKHGYHPEELGVKQIEPVNEKLDEMIKEGDVSIQGYESPGNPNDPPYADSNGIIYVISYPASDSAHAPADGANWDDMVAGTAPFEDDFGVNIILGGCYNCWDASDVDDDAYNLIEDLKEDIDYGTYNTVIVGWVDDATLNGIGVLSGHYSLCAEAPVWWVGKVNWPDDSVVQHELSHNFDAQDQDESGGNCKGECIMNYYWAWNWGAGTDRWCSYHYGIVENGVWGPNG